jgi:hypothetical protein
MRTAIEVAYIVGGGLHDSIFESGGLWLASTCYGRVLEKGDPRRTVASAVYLDGAQILLI